MSDLHFETFKPEQVSELAGFLSQEYPEGEISNERFLRWEYLENPFGKAVVSLAKDVQNNIVSQYALIPLQVIVNGNKISASLSLNTLTAEGWRGKGLFTRTAANAYNFCADNDIQFTIGIPNANSYPGFINKLQFSHAGFLLFAVKPLRPVNIIKSFIKRDKIKKGSEIDLRVEEPVCSSGMVSYFNPEKDADLYIDFWNRQIKTGMVIVERSIEYLQWRYFKNPMRKYHVFKLCDQGNMQAFISVRALNVYGMKTGVVMDFFSATDLHGTVLLNSVMGVLMNSGLDIVIAASAGRNVSYSILRKSGFLKLPEFLLPQKLPFIFRAHQQFEYSEQAGDIRNWHFTFSDYDIF